MPLIIIRKLRTAVQGNGLIKVLKDHSETLWRLYCRRPDGNRETTWGPVASPARQDEPGWQQVGWVWRMLWVYLKGEEMALVNGLMYGSEAWKESPRKHLLFLLKWSVNSGGEDEWWQSLSCIHVDFEIPISYSSGPGKNTSGCVSCGALRMNIRVWK